MSQSVERLTCIFCKSTNITFNPSDQTITCNDCGVKYMAPLYYFPEVVSSGSVVAGTQAPKPLVKTEEFGYRKVIQVFPHEHPEFKTLENEITDLKKSIDQLDGKVEELRGISPKVIIMEEVPKEEAKRRVAEFLRGYMKRHENVYPSDVADELGLKYELVREIFDILEKERKLEKKAK